METPGWMTFSITEVSCWVAHRSSSSYIYKSPLSDLPDRVSICVCCLSLPSLSLQDHYSSPSFTSVRTRCLLHTSYHFSRTQWIQPLVGVHSRTVIYLVFFFIKHFVFLFIFCLLFNLSRVNVYRRVQTDPLWKAQLLEENVCVSAARQVSILPK